jgi:hypothetical protein
VQIWRIEEGLLRQVTSVAVCDAWVSYLAWSMWQEENGTGKPSPTKRWPWIDPPRAFTRLACGTSNGQVQIIDIRYEPNLGEPQVSVQLSKDTPSRLDPRGITALEWIYPEGHDVSYK